MIFKNTIHGDIQEIPFYIDW